MSSRYDHLFSRLTEANEGAFVPFVMLGDPDLDTSFEIITSLVDGGADALELGIPFSDPVADGPTIQAAHIRALDAGVTVDQALSLVVSTPMSPKPVPIPSYCLTFLSVRGLPSLQPPRPLAWTRFSLPRHTPLKKHLRASPGIRRDISTRCLAWASPVRSGNPLRMDSLA